MRIFDPANTFLAEDRAPALDDLTDRSNQFEGVIIWNAVSRNKFAKNVSPCYGAVATARLNDLR